MASRINGLEHYVLSTVIWRFLKALWCLSCTNILIPRKPMAMWDDIKKYCVPWRHPRSKKIVCFWHTIGCCSSGCTHKLRCSLIYDKLGNASRSLHFWSTRCYCPRYSWIRETQSNPNLFFTWHDSYIYINCFFGLTGSVLFLVLTYWESVQRLATGRQSGARSPVGAWDFPFSRTVQTVSGVHPHSQSTGTGVPSMGNSPGGGWSSTPPPSSSHDRKKWISTSAALYIPSQRGQE